VEYSSLVLATGGRPFVPPVEGADLPGVVTVRTLGEAASLGRRVGPGLRLVVVGAGLAGTKLAVIAARRGASVTLVEMREVLWTVLDPPLTRLAAGPVSASGVRIIEGAPVERILGGERVSAVEAGGERVPADLVVFSTGVRPDSDLARSMGLELGVRGAVRTDERMGTSEEGVWAAGDCAETIDAVSKKKTYRPIGSIAYMGGRVAGLNSVGVGEEYGGFLRRQAEEMPGLRLVSVGLTGAEADALGVRYERVPLEVRAGPGIPWWLRTPFRAAQALVDPRGRLVGFQAVGGRFPRRAASAVSRVILSGGGLADLEPLGLAPPRF